MCLVAVDDASNGRRFSVFVLQFLGFPCSVSGGRLVANAVTAESEAVLLGWHSRIGGELRRYQHYRAEPLGGFTGWRPAMPITQWVVAP